MKQAQSLKGRVGWDEREQSVLWEEVRACNAQGRPLRAAFENTAQKTGRKANSIRNHYYAVLKEQGAPEDLRLKRAVPFTPFTQEESEALIRHVLQAQGQGQSVRACVLELSKGDKTQALRLQNKYRSLLKSHAERVRAVAAELERQGLPFADPYSRKRSLPRHGRPRKDAAQDALPDLLRRMDGDAARQLLCAVADALQAL